jgi:NitT/TauT family transport system substrate-binding protein
MNSEERNQPQMFARTFRIALPLLAAGLLAVVVASASAKSVNPKAAAASAQVTTLHVGYTTDPENLPVIVALQEGYFKKAGLTVSLTALSQTSTLIPAIGKQYNMLEETPVDVLLARAQGLDVSFILGQSAESEGTQDAGLVVEKGVTSLAGLKGKTIAVPSLSGILYGALVVALHQAGISKSEVRFLVEPLPNEGTLLEKGRVDAALTVQPFVDGLTSAGYKNLGDPVMDATDKRLSMDTGFAVSTKFAQQNPKTVAAFKKAEYQAYSWMKSHRSGDVADLEKYFQLPAAVAKGYPLMPYIHLGASEAELQEWIKPLESAGLLSPSKASTENLAYIAN